ncbi:MAG: tRNA epoxyqueuosine(34) reductase QueG [Anaerolineaceae bacterium]|nr:tRNA epoxyqueuosine(34) reductase QueG [Anaerolineaceae bacterium]
MAQPLIKLPYQAGKIYFMDLVIEKMIRAKAKRLGFSFISFTEAKKTPHFSNYLNWLKNDKHTYLPFLDKEYVINATRNPDKLLKDAKSVIILGVNYGPVGENWNFKPQNDGTIASYAIYDDYHHIIRKKAIELMNSINHERINKIKFRIFIDSGPVMEKDFAFAAGLGWIGKNSLFIHPKFGSFSFLCCILVDSPLNENASISKDLCKDCQRCIQACPTHCISSNHTIKTQRCISYLTIEHKEVIPYSLRSLIGNNIFGCDICQEVCPYNHIQLPEQPILFFNLEKRRNRNIDLSKAFQLSEPEFLDRFAHSPILRLSYQQFLRNIVIAAGNTQNSKYILPLSRLLVKGTVLVRIHAAWALGKIGRPDCATILSKRLTSEDNENVREEISRAIDSISYGSHTA